jgi:BirA family transcriptional regulator, biotin operon repressor / biotin---[acetyl-CoA-carboxylase] ligase
MTYSFDALEKRQGSFVSGILRLETVDSTNEYLKRLIRSKQINHGTVILSKHQNLGRGQMGTSWQDELGSSILMSLVLRRPPIRIERQFLLNMSICLSVFDVLSNRIDGVAIKWPNDIMIKGKKCSGILIENILSTFWEHSIVGIGINVNNSNFIGLEKATSLALESGVNAKLSEVERELFDSLDSRLEQLWQMKWNQISADYHDRLVGKGVRRKYEFKGELVEGSIQGVRESGQLIFLCADGSYLYPNIKELVYLENIE